MAIDDAVRSDAFAIHFGALPSRGVFPLAVVGVNFAGHSADQVVVCGNCVAQCFSTFWTPSPGKRKILKLLSRSKKNVLSLFHNNLCSSAKKHELDVIFTWIVVQNHVKLTKFNNLTLIQGEICKFWIFKIIPSPGEKVSKSRYRDASRWLRNAGVADRPGEHSVEVDVPLESNYRNSFMMYFKKTKMRTLCRNY